MIDLRHLRALNAIAQHGGLTAAAKTLHCTQSALSHLITDLERQERLPLLRRDCRPLQLTVAGRRLLAAAETVLPLLATLDDDLDRLRRGTSGRLLLSLECHSCFEWLVPTLDTYRASHPQVELDLRVGASFDPLPALADGLVDLFRTRRITGHPRRSVVPLSDCCGPAAAAWVGSQGASSAQGFLRPDGGDLSGG